MKFSILVPVYNVEEYIEECLESLVSQTFQDYEIILVNDGSTDSSGEICDFYKTKYPNMIVHHKKNEGLISARRVGLSLARGEYCIFCDSDDYLQINALETLNNIINTCAPDIVIYNAYMLSGNEKKKFFENLFDEGFLLSKEKLLDKLLLTYQINSLCIKAIRRSIIDIQKDYSRLYAYNYGEDLLQSIPPIIQSNTIYYLNQPLYTYRVTSGMMKKFNENYYTSYKCVNHEISSYIKDTGLIDYKEKLGVHLLTAAYGAVLQFKFLQKTEVLKLKNIAEDSDFRVAYETVMNSCYKKFISKKQNLVLKNLYTQNFNTLKILLFLGRIKNRI